MAVLTAGLKFHPTALQKVEVALEEEHFVLFPPPPTRKTQNSEKKGNGVGGALPMMMMKRETVLSVGCAFKHCRSVCLYVKCHPSHQ